MKDFQIDVDETQGRVRFECDLSCLAPVTAEASTITGATVAFEQMEGTGTAKVVIECLTEANQ